MVSLYVIKKERSEGLVGCVVRQVLWQYDQ